MQVVSQGTFLSSLLRRSVPLRHAVGIDWGSSKLGVALWRVEEDAVLPLTTLRPPPLSTGAPCSMQNWTAHCSTALSHPPPCAADRSAFMARELWQLLRRRQCTHLAVGWPLTPAGAVGTTCQRVADFLQTLQGHSPPRATEPLQVVLVDERGTSAAARQVLAGSSNAGAVTWGAGRILADVAPAQKLKPSQAAKVDAMSAALVLEILRAALPAPNKSTPEHATTPSLDVTGRQAQETGMPSSAGARASRRWLRKGHK